MNTPNVRDAGAKGISDLLQIEDQVSRLQKPLEVASSVCVKLPVNILVL